MQARGLSLLPANLALARAQPALEVVRKSLQEAAAALDPAATLQVLGKQAMLNLRQVRALAAGALPHPVAVQLQHTHGAEPLWSGSLVFRLPGAAPAQS